MKLLFRWMRKAEIVTKKSYLERRDSLLSFRLFIVYIVLATLV